MDVTLQEAMFHNAGEKGIRLDGTQCLKRKGTKKNKKRREAYKRKKEQKLRIETTNGCII
jgi:hypothetical protein